MGIKSRIIFALLILLALNGCSGHRSHPKTVLPENSLQAICQARNIEWQWDSISQVFTFSTKGVPAKVLVGSNLAILGDKRVILSKTVERKDSMIIVPPDFVEKIFGQNEQKPVVGIEPVVAIGKCREIMIDAGHGGKDPGARGLGGAVEKDIVLDIAQRVKSGLEKQGFKVSMTRDSDEFISLQKRTELASSSKADLFVSIHANATKSKKTKGLEIYYSRGLERDADLDQRRINEKMFLSRLKVGDHSDVVGRIVKDMMYSNKQIESVAVANRMIEKTSKMVSTPNRGGRPCGFFVVKNTLIPAILFEVGYITNASEAKSLRSEEHRQKIADAITASISEYSNES